MSPCRRADLRQVQVELVQSVTGGDCPPGFDRRQIALTAASLRTKRYRTVVRTWPVLSEALGERFEVLFDRYARSSRPPSHGGALADGRRFIRVLAEENLLTDAIRLAALSVDLRWTDHPEGLVRRRRPAIRAVRLRESPAWVIAVWFPRSGERRLVFRRPRLGRSVSLTSR